MESELGPAENQFLRAFIEARHKHLGGNLSGVELASKLNISRNTLRSYVKRLGLKLAGAET